MKKLKSLFFLCLFLLSSCTTQAMIEGFVEKKVEEEQRANQIEWTFQTFIAFLKTSGKDLFALCDIKYLLDNPLLNEIKQKKALTQNNIKVKQIDPLKYIYPRLASILHENNYEKIFIKKIDKNLEALNFTLTDYFYKHKWPINQIAFLAEELECLAEKIIKLKIELKNNPKILETKKFENDIKLPATAMFSLLARLFWNAKILI